MSDAHLIMWAGVMLLGFVGSALYSGLETGCYCLNRVRLHVRANRREGPAMRLERIIRNPTSLLSTLLIGNNLANYMGTASLAVILSASGLTEGQQILLNVLVVTPVLFVFGETLPKDLFSAHADGLMYRLQPVLSGSKRLFSWTLLVPLIAAFSAGVMRVMGQKGDAAAFHPRRRVGDLVKESVGAGLLSDRQSEMVDRVLGAATLDAASQMTPWRQAPRVRAADPIRGVIERARTGTLPAIPVVDAAGKVVGVVPVIDALRVGAVSGQRAHDLMQPVVTVRGDRPLRRALADLSRESAELAVVIGRGDQPIGVVTLNDLIEPITGPLPV